MRTRSDQEVGIKREEDIMCNASIIKKEKITIGISEEDTQAKRKRTKEAGEEQIRQWNARVINQSRTKTLLSFRQMASLTRLVREVRSKGIHGWSNHLA